MRIAISAKVMKKVCEILQSEKGRDVIKAVWKAAAITDVLMEARSDCTSMNQFSLLFVKRILPILHFLTYEPHSQ